MKSKLILAGLGLAVGLLVSACGSRRHMGDEYGVSLRQAFASQVVHPQPARTAAKPVGLEPDEARAVYENYRQSLIAKEKGAHPFVPQGLIVVGDEDDGTKKARPRKR